MLSNTTQFFSFDQFLVSQFLQKDECQTLKTDKKKTECKETLALKKDVVKKETAKSQIKFSAKAEAFDKLANSEFLPDISNLAKIIDSIPDRLRAMNISELATKHESEWYHAFRDLRDEINEEVSKRRPHSSSVLEMHRDAKDYASVLDDHIEKVILEIERIFQVFPNMSRVALIYLLSIIIAVPLMFFSVVNDRPMAYNFPEKTLELTTTKVSYLTNEIKSKYIADNSSKILASGKEVYKAADLGHKGKVAGVYEESDKNQDLSQAGQKVSKWYRYLLDLKDELGNILK